MIALLTAGAVAMAVSLLSTWLLIPWLQKRGIGQPIQLDGPQGHMTKKGTPTMGGLSILAGALAGFTVSHLRGGGNFSSTGVVLMMAVVLAGIVGLIDDYLKVSNERNVGLNKRAKLIGLIIVGVTFALVATFWLDSTPIISFTRIGFIDLELPRGVWIIWSVLVVLAVSNSVNLTDGLDGLAGGAAAIAFAAFVIVAYWAFRNPNIYEVKDPLDLAVTAAALAGACAGFLWWNAPPARIFMGDTGSLAIGTALAGLGLLLHVDLLLPIIGGLYLIETMSVIMQVGSFRLFGRRIFRMAPIHHHFELAGWPETTVLIRLWVINGLLVAVALVIYYADYLSLDLIQVPANSL